MGVLDRQLRIRRAPVLGVAGTFEKMDARDRRKSRDLLHREDQRLLHQPMHDQPVLERVDRRRPGMVALIVKPVGGDDAGKILERREAERRQPRRRLRQAMTISAHDIGFEAGGAPIGGAHHFFSGMELPFRNRGRQVVALLRKRRAGGKRRSHRAGAGLDQASTGDAARDAGRLGLCRAWRLMWASV